MNAFDYEKILPTLMTPAVVNAVSGIHEHRGKQDLYLVTEPDRLERLCEVAKIQSTGASNRIEGIGTSDGRLRDLVEMRTEPRNRDEREIAGYRYALNMIHESHDHIDVTPGVLLRLHRDLYRYQDVPFAGRWKDSDNVIAERDEEGGLVARFVPTSALLAPDAVTSLCDTYAVVSAEGVWDPLLVCCLFVFDFVSIHPFSDGNGRMSRLLTLLLLYRGGYLVGKYVSIEQEIENTKETYHEALAASSIGWADGANDYLPFVTYLLGVVSACYKALDERMAVVSSEGTNEGALRAYFGGLVGSASKRRIMDDNPQMSQKTIERILRTLQEEGVVEKIGAARSTSYRKVRETMAPPKAER
ncbi:MAG: Fic family protein [Atopobiaceae bacterium]|jgi:Fic family protein